MDLSHNEKVFRVISGLLILASIYIPFNFSRYILWILALILLVTGLSGKRIKDGLEDKKTPLKKKKIKRR